MADFTREEISQMLQILPEDHLAVTYKKDEGLRMAAFSPGMAERMGLSKKETAVLFEKEPLGWMLAADRKLSRSALEDAFAEGEPFSYICRCVYAQKGHCWAKLRMTFPGMLEGRKLGLCSVYPISTGSEPLAVLLENCASALCVVDRDSHEVLYVNQEYARLVGHTTEGCIGRQVEDVFGRRPDIGMTDIQNRTKVYYVAENGRFLDIKGMEFPWGMHKAMAIFISDVTEQRRQTMEAALTARRHLEAVMRMNPDAMSTFHINLTQNRFVSGMSNYESLRRLQEKGTIEGYVADALACFPYPAERERFAERFDRKHLLAEFEAGHTQVEMKHHFMLTDREERILHTFVYMVQNMVSKDVSAVIYTLDITRESYYSRIQEVMFNNSNIGIVVINPGRSTFIVPQTSSLLGFSTGYEAMDYEQGLQKLVEMYLPEEERESYLAHARLSCIIEHLEQDERYSFAAYWMKDGQRRNIRLNCYYLDETKEKIIGVAEDITEVETELRLKEQELKKALETARSASRAKSEFLSSMSHDIRTPLNAIVNLTSLLYDEICEPEKLKEDIQKIETAGEFLLQLINDVLDVSAIESGNLKLVPRVYTYATFLNYIKGIIVPLCEDKDLHFVLDEGPTALDIYMDRVRFHQVFFNILSNAVKYTPPGGTITFRTTNNVVHDGILTCDFIVSDTGRGMSPEFIKRAFEPFVREDSQNAYIGTGLGLAICKRIVDLMGGTIRIDSEIGKGTTVTVHMDLQIATEEQKAESQAEMDSSYHRNVMAPRAEECRILVVEDNEINREILTRMLEKKGYLVECAENGKEALDILLEKDGSYYQLILMDIRMPVMNGLEATKHIRRMEEEAKSHIPIIAITANAFESDVEECLNAGMNCCLAKPISPNDLYNMLANYMQPARQAGVLSPENAP